MSTSCSIPPGAGMRELWNWPPASASVPPSDSRNAAGVKVLGDENCHVHLVTSSGPAYPPSSTSAEVLSTVPAAFCAVIDAGTLLANAAESSMRI